MTVTLPEVTSVLGTRSVWVVPKSAATTGDALSIADLTAGFKATCFLYDGGIVTGEQQTGDAPRKQCEIKSRQKLGTVQEQLSPMQYSYKPQGASGDAANGMKAACVQGTVVYIVERNGITDATTPTTTHVYNVFEVELGYQQRTRTGDDDQAEFSITQGGSILNSYYDRTLVATG